MKNGRPNSLDADIYMMLPDRSGLLYLPSRRRESQTSNSQSLQNQQPLQSQQSLQSQQPLQNQQQLPTQKSPSIIQPAQGQDTFQNPLYELPQVYLVDDSHESFGDDDSFQTESDPNDDLLFNVWSD